MDGAVFYRQGSRSSNSCNITRVRRSPSVASSSPSNGSSSSNEDHFETPLRSRRNENAIASSLSLCQAQLSSIMKKLDETTVTLSALSDRIEFVEEKLASQDQENITPSPSSSRKRKRPKDSLTIQEEVHKLHAKREERNQYKGLESVCTPHNKAVTSYLTKQIKEKGYDEIKVERAAKKFHEHIRRVAQGKCDDAQKEKMKMSNRKGRKYKQRKSCLDIGREKEVRAFNSLTKDHMSSDEDDPNDSSQWMSRRPNYRSETLTKFLQKLDKVHNKRVAKDRKLIKKIKRVQGEPKEVAVPENTPLWAIDREWLKNRDQATGVNQHEPEQSEDDEEQEVSQESSDESEIEFD